MIILSPIARNLVDGLQSLGTPSATLPRVKRRYRRCITPCQIGRARRGPTGPIELLCECAVGGRVPRDDGEKSVGVPTDRRGEVRIRGRGRVGAVPGAGAGSKLREEDYREGGHCDCPEGVPGEVP